MIYIALLRGINVSGKNKLPMADLKQLLLPLGFKNLTTYIQSGNIIFEAEKGEWEAPIKEAIYHKFQYDVPTLVLSVEQLENMLTTHPYQHLDPAFLHITFLKATPDPALVASLNLPAAEGELCSIEGQTVYLYLPHGYGRTKLNNNYFENKLKVQATTRNWKTSNKLLEMVKSLT